MWLPPTSFPDHRHWVRILARTERALTLGKTALIDAQHWESTKGTPWPCVTQHPVKSMTHPISVRTDQGSLGCSLHTATLEHSSGGQDSEQGQSVCILFQTSGEQSTSYPFSDSGGY